MKQLFAILLLCLSAQLSAGGRCTASHAARDNIARATPAKPIAQREAARFQKVRPLAAWQRMLVFEQQIL